MLCFKKRNDNCVAMRAATSCLGSFRFVAIFVMSLERSMFAWGALPPLLENTTGMKDPFSTLFILSLYLDSFCCSHFLSASLGFWSTCTDD